MNEKIDKLIDCLKIETQTVDGVQYFLFVPEKSETKNNIYEQKTKKELRDEIRKILGLDEQCFQCSEYCFKDDLSIVEGTNNLVCQDCAEKIINGTLKLREV